MSFIAYSDESHITAHRYRSISLFSFPVASEDEIVQRLSEDLSSSNVSEFKWKKLDSAKYRHCALKLIDSVMDALLRMNARVDTIIWDTHDKRHAVQHRDDNENFGRMFFHLHGKAFKRRKKESIWKIRPDERMGVDWQTIRQCLEATGRRRELVRSPLFGDFFSDSHFTVSDLREIDSKNSPCCQIADLFAGIAVFSRVNHPRFWKWHALKTPSLGLYPEEKLQLSGSEAERFPVLDYLNRCCKKNSLGVSLKGKGGLYTYKPENPLNFWLYEPQHDADQAPAKSGIMSR